MRTYKPISTISYCSEQFLKNRLEELKQEDVITFYCVCFHKGFEGKKDHFHIYVEPTDTINTDSKEWVLRFEEPTATEVLGTMPWQKSKWKDWFLYAKHDKRYLKAKGLL